MPENVELLTPSADAYDADAERITARPLSDALAHFESDPDPVSTPEPGSVPLPEAWELMRAVFGGASRDAIERRHGRLIGDTTAVLQSNIERENADESRYADAMARGALGAGLHVVAGHTGGGKTALACEMARTAALAGHPVVYVSLELDAREIAARMIALQAALPWAILAADRPLAQSSLENGLAMARKRDAIDKLREPLGAVYVWAPDPGPDDPAPHVAELRAFVREVWERHGNRVPLVVFDYLQAPGIYARDEEQERRLPIRERLGAVIMQLRHLSKAEAAPVPDAPAWTGCPVLVLSTTARSNVTGKEATPGMSGDDSDDIRWANLEDLKALPKEAGEIEAASVTAWALSLTRSEHDGPRRLTLRLAKARKLPDGQWLPLRFDGITGRISDDPTRYPPGRERDEQRAKLARLELVARERKEREKIAELEAANNSADTPAASARSDDELLNAPAPARGRNGR